MNELSRKDKAALRFLHYAVPVMVTQGREVLCWRCLFRVAWAMHLLREFR